MLKLIKYLVWESYFKFWYLWLVLARKVYYFPQHLDNALYRFYMKYG